MSLEKGIGRLGTVGGIICGLIGGLYAWAFSIAWIDDQIRWSQQKYSDSTIILGTLILVVVSFIAIFFAVKGIAETINWVIKGFKE